MKKEKRSILTIALMMLFILFMAMNVSAAGIETIGSTSNAKTYQYKMKASDLGSMVIPVKLTSGGEVHLDICFKTDMEKVHIILSSKSSMLDDTGWISVYNGKIKDQHNLSAYRKNACTLYLYILREGSGDHDMDITVKAYQRKVSTGGILKKGKWISGYAAGRGAPIYYKVAVPASGGLKVDTRGSGMNGAAQIELLDSRKKTMKDLGESAEKTSYFGVKKGTYYIKLVNDGAFKLCYSLERIKEKNNTVRSRAVSLKKGKIEKGVSAIGDKKDERYYKLVLNKDQTITGNISVKSNGRYSCLISQRVGKKEKTVKYMGLKKGDNKVRMRLKKGTYYVMLYTAGNGSYSIQWR